MLYHYKAALTGSGALLGGAKINKGQRTNNKEEFNHEPSRTP
jgi:hypothetical protein